MSAPVYEFGPFRLDAEKKAIWRHGEFVPLTPKALADLKDEPRFERLMKRVHGRS